MSLTLSEALIENLPAAISIFDASGRVRLWNKNFLGYSSEEMLQAGILSTIPPESLNAVQQVMIDVFELGKAESDAWLIAKSGAKIPCYLMGVRMVFEDEPCILGVAIDLSKQKQAEEAGRQSDQAAVEASARLKAIFESVQTGILVIDPETHRIVDANPAALQVINSSSDRVLGAECHQFICPAHRGACPVTDLGQTFDQAERVLLTASGEKRDILKTVVNVQIAGRDHLLESFVDITERKRTEGSLKLFRALVDQANDAILAFDLETFQYIDVNERACRDLGYTREELLSLSIPDVDARFDETSVQAQADIRTKGFSLFETLHRRKDGSTFPVEVATKRVVLDKTYIVSTARDITERKHTEESLKLFRTLMDQSNDGIAVSDRETQRFLDVNERAGSSLGYTREEMLSLSVSDVIVCIQEVQEQIEEDLQFQGSAVFEAMARRKDGSTFPIEVAAREVLLDRRYLLTISRDMTERKLVIDKLRSSEARLARENRLAEIFLTVPDDQMFSEVLDVVLQEMSSDSGLFGFIDEQGTLVVPSLRGQIWEACKMLDKSLNFPRELWGGAWGRTLIEKTACLSNQPGHVPDGHVPILRYMVTPILHGDKVIGVLAVANKSTDYDEADKESLAGIASYLAPVLNARLQRDVEERGRKRAEETILGLARTDSLTGLANRRVLEETLPRETARAQRLLEPLSAIFADLDHFKSINDEFGHQVGDQVLASIGALLKSQLRSYALASRYGGDEFVLLLPGTTRNEAVIVAERIREKLAAMTVAGCARNFTVSLGVASFVTGESGAELVARADEALYKAKHKGGNRVEVI